MLSFVFLFNSIMSFMVSLGPSHVSGEDDVVQWVTDGETGIKNMQYKEGRLKIQEDGHYYLYSKVQLIGVEECKLIQHKVMKNTSAYGMSIDLMQSKRYGRLSFFTSFPPLSCHRLAHVFRNTLLLQI